MYNGALADMQLGSDPFTRNRYAFTGGNPSTFVEYDGHIFGCDWCDKAINAVKGGGTKTLKGSWGLVSDVFLNAWGWNDNQGWQKETPYDQDNPNHGLGLYVTPEKEVEYRQHDFTPVNQSQCSTKGNSGVYYSPLDELGRVQGVQACLSSKDESWVNGKTGLINGNARFKVDGNSRPQVTQPAVGSPGAKAWHAAGTPAGKLAGRFRARPEESDSAVRKGQPSPDVRIRGH
nr:hypothetical protein OG461_33990 [Streptomyces sp. NBC_00995]